MDYPLVTPLPLRKCKLCNVRGMDTGYRKRESDGKKRTIACGCGGYYIIKHVIFVIV